MIQLRILRSAGPAVFGSRITTRLIKPSLLRVRTQDAVGCSAVLRGNLDWSAVRRLAILDPVYKLSHEMVRVATGAARAMAEARNFKVAVKVMNIGCVISDGVVVFLRVSRWDEIISLLLTLV